MIERDVVRLHHGGKSGRPGVVVQIIGGEAPIVFATKKDRRRSPSVVVEKNTKEARLMGFNITSHFYPEEVRWIQVDRLPAAPKIGRCPRDILHALRAVADALDSEPIPADQGGSQ